MSGMEHIVTEAEFWESVDEFRRLGAPDPEVARLSVTYLDFEGFEREFAAELANGLIALGVDATVVEDEEILSQPFVETGSFPISAIFVSGHGFCCSVGVWCEVPDDRISKGWGFTFARTRLDYGFFRLKNSYFEAAPRVPGGVVRQNSLLLAERLNRDSEIRALLHSGRYDVTIDMDGDLPGWTLNFDNFFEIKPDKLRSWRDFCLTISNRLLSTQPFEAGHVT